MSGEPEEDFYPPDDSGERVEWRVVWFPPHKPYAVKTGTEAAVRSTAKREAEWNPMVESCRVIRTAWEQA